MPPNWFRLSVGITAIVLGALGAALLALAFALLAAHTTVVGPFDPGNGERVLTLTTKLALITFGILLLARSRWALLVLCVVLVLSTLDTLLMLPLFWQAPATGDAIARIGRTVGRIVGSGLPPLAYTAALVYLLICRRRSAAAAPAAAATAVPPVMPAPRS